MKLIVDIFISLCAQAARTHFLIVHIGELPIKVQLKFCFISAEGSELQLVGIAYCGKMGQERKDGSRSVPNFPH